MASVSYERRASEAAWPMKWTCTASNAHCSWFGLRSLSAVYGHSGEPQYDGTYRSKGGERTFAAVWMNDSNAQFAAGVWQALLGRRLRLLCHPSSFSLLPQDLRKSPTKPTTSCLNLHCYQCQSPLCLHLRLLRHTISFRTLRLLAVHGAP